MGAGGEKEGDRETEMESACAKKKRSEERRNWAEGQRGGTGIGTKGTEDNGEGTEWHRSQKKGPLKVGLPSRSDWEVVVTQNVNVIFLPGCKELMYGSRGTPICLLQINSDISRAGMNLFVCPYKVCANDLCQADCFL